MNGYAGKMLFVDLTTGKMEEKPLEEKMAREFLGGPALGARILYEYMPAHTEVFAPESVAGSLGGPVNSSGAFFGGRYTVVSKSPLTGGWNDANSGGFFAPALKKSGYDAVFFRGISEKPVYLLISDGKAELCDAADLWGKTSLEAEAWLTEKYGKTVQAAMVGPAGERQAYLACVMNNGHRAAGRGGTGAVFGSKKLKAVVVVGGSTPKPADRAAILELNKAITASMKEGPGAGFAGAFGEYGTGVGFVGSVLSGDAGIKNWSGAGVTDFPEEVAMPAGSIGMGPFKKKKYNCSNCPLGCGAILDIPSDKYDLRDAPRPEYETQGAFGSLLLNNDPAVIAQCNNLCNEYGLDVISTGSTIAWAMECYNEGVLSKEELDGVELTWGNGDAIVELCSKICRGDGIGAILGLGSQEACRRLGKGEEFLVVASGIEEPQHDSRLAHGLARTYKYDPTPGRHVKGGIGMFPLPPDYDYSASGEADKQGVIKQEICNAAGFCMFGDMLMPPGTYKKLIEAVTGFTYTDEEYDAIGMRSFYMRQAFNLREGMTRKSFTLSRRFTQSPPPAEGPLKDADVPVEQLADNFFDAMHMDRETLIPEEECLKTLGGLELLERDFYGKK